MKQDVVLFLRKTCNFVLPLLALIGYVEVRLSRVPNSYNLKRMYLERQLDSVEVLILGSSRAYNGIDPNCLSLRAFNLADVSQSLYYDTRLLRKYVDRMPRLRCVLLEVSYFSLGYQIADSREAWRDYFYYHFWGIRYRNLSRFDPKLVSYIALYGVKPALKCARKSFHEHLVRQLQSSGWWKEDTVLNGRHLSDSFGKARVAYHDSIIKPAHFAENLHDLGALLGELRRRHIAAVIFSAPVLDSYSLHTNPAINLRNQQAIDSLCSVYGCCRADYSDDKRFEVMDFTDADHLNARGAGKFSRILDHDSIAATESSIPGVLTHMPNQPAP
jgi:hypothetical protein